MNSGQFHHDDPPCLNNQRVPGSGAFPDMRPTGPITQLVTGHGRIPAQPFDRQSYPPERTLLRPGEKFGIHHYAIEGNEYMSHSGPTLLPPHLQVIHNHSRGSVIDAHGQRNASGSHQQVRRTFQSATGPDDHQQGCVAGSWPRGHAQQPFGFNQTFQLNWHRSDSESAHHPPISLGDHTSTLGDRLYEEECPAINQRYTPAPYHNNLELGAGVPHPELSSFRRTDQSTSLPGRPPAEAATYYGQQQPSGAAALTGVSERTIDTPSYAERRDAYDPCSGGAREEVSESPRQPTGVQRPRSRNKAKGAVVPERAVLARKRRRRRKPSGPAAQVPTVSFITHGSTQFKMIPQTTYESLRRQDGRVRQPQINFGWLRLKDAIDKEYLGIPGYSDSVLDYAGVGSSVSCRLNFSGCDIASKKISTTNHKCTPEPITKKKLALAIAKFVESHIGTIRAQTHCSDVTFEKVVLTNVCHVSQASWQPELWCEVTTPGCD